MKRTLLVASLAAASQLALATVQYKVTAAVGQPLSVSMNFEANDNPVLHLPNWAPGSYNLKEDWRTVKELKVVDASGKAIEAKRDGNAWSIPAKKGTKLTVTYQQGGALQEDGTHFSGPGTYLYIEGRTQEASTVSFALPAGWSAELGIVPKNGVYAARSYDELADNPVSIGVLTTDKFRAANTNYVIVYRGSKQMVDQLDRPFVIDQCRSIAEAQCKFFGGSPNQKYVFHFMLSGSQDGGWGLEHLSSTTIGLATGLGKGTIGVVSHEHFHLWNVKRIRSFVLGPFDYTKLPQTGALWWLEGVTDYYAHVFLARSGFYTEEDLYNQILRNYNAVMANAAHTTVSPYESSFRVGEANNGRGNSSGYQISYYQLGLLAGLILDTELREVTKGKYSLDDVERDLFQQTKDWKPGFAEDGIRKTLVKYGGAALGQMYDEIIMKPGDPRIPQALDKLGLELADATETNGVLGFMGNVVPGTGVVVDRVIPPSPDLQAKDVIVSMNGKSLVSPNFRQGLANFRAAWNKKAPGTIISMEVKTGDQVRTVSWKLGVPSSSTSARIIRRKANATPEQVKRLEAWLKG